MKTAIYYFFLTALIIGLSKNESAAQNSTGKSKIDEKVKTLLSKMTLEEKVGQMGQITLDVIGTIKNANTSQETFALKPEAMEKVFNTYKIGSVLNTTNNRALSTAEWNKIIDEIQSSGKGRLGIPVIYGIDAIHGATYTIGGTMFPQQIGQGASRNLALVKKAAAITAYETRASGIPWNFSPLLDLGQDPRFPRIWETYGEDPFLCAVMGKEAIKGFEGDDNNISTPFTLASCMKHFLGYQTSISGKDRTPSIISDQALREYHLPSFKAAIAAGSHTLMVNSGIINGVPVHANYDILTELLRNELGFKGVVVTDWNDVEKLYDRDKVAKNMKEALMMAINAGVDMSMIPYNYKEFSDDLVALVKEGKVKQSRIDEAVTRILTLKYQLNLFDKPVTYAKDYPKFGSKEFENAAYQAAVESITLLKNSDNILPLKKTAKVLVTGPNANSMRTLNGAWSYSWQGEKTERFTAKYHTIVEALQKKAGEKNVSFIPGVSYKMDGKYYEQYADQMDEAIREAKSADVIVLCLGENTYTEKLGNLSNMDLDRLQLDYAKKLAETGKPIVLILNEGRPRVFSEIEPAMKGVVMAYLPGNFGGDALASILYGDENPSGKLPFNYPRYANSLVPYIHKPSEVMTSEDNGSNYEATYNPQYEFGFGLSYTTFDYSNLNISKNVINADESLTVTVDVKNTGNKEGKEVVDLYLSDLYASITPDVKRLKAFEKINLKPGESKTITFKLTKDDFSFVNAKGKTVVEPGEFSVSINKLKKKFSIDL